MKTNDSNDETETATREVLWVGDRPEVERAAKRTGAARITQGRADEVGNVTGETTVWRREEAQP